MTKMKHKWEWIQDVCIANGFDCAAIVADQINTLLLEIYGDIHTDNWKRDYLGYFNKSVEEYTLDDIEDMVSGYCIACVIHGKCDSCIFGRRIGYCEFYETTSLYKEFLDELDKVE